MPTEITEMMNGTIPVVAGVRCCWCNAWMKQGRVVSMTPRALGRFMTLPDWYVLPEKKTLASKIIGNGFPCLAAEKILRQLLEAL